ITYLQQGAKMSLTCHIGGEDTGVVWVHQKNVETFKFIVFISPLSGAIFEGNQKTSPRYEARKEDMFYHLVVKSFTPQDEGNYFCIKYINKQPYFSPGQLVFLSVTTTVAPTTCGPSPKHGITEDPNIPDPASRTSEDLDYFCLVFLWVPLAGLCLLLLQLLATTLVL
ncbi:CD8A protein, partial [Regulus satrapa]|nr:CD8A protein [Regulus satrapa]